MAWLSRFTRLRALSIKPDDSFLVVLPPRLQELTSLRELELEGQLLGLGEQNMCEEAFATGICQLTGLTRLHLHDVKLGGGAGSLNLGGYFDDEEEEEAWLEQELERWYRLPEAITQLQALQSLTIYEHALCSEFGLG